MKALVIVALLAATAHAEDRGFHGSVGGGGALLITGEAGGSRLRLEGEVDIEPGGGFGRYGGLLAIRAADKDHLGILCAGLIFEAAASRPRIVLGLHVDLGVDLDGPHPAFGGGIRTTLKIWRALGIALDNGAYLVIDGVRTTRIAFGGSTSIVLRW